MGLYVEITLKICCYLCWLLADWLADWLTDQSYKTTMFALCWMCRHIALLQQQAQQTAPAGWRSHQSFVGGWGVRALQSQLAGTGPEARGNFPLVSGDAWTWGRREGQLSLRFWGCWVGGIV